MQATLLHTRVDTRTVRLSDILCNPRIELGFPHAAGGDDSLCSFHENEDLAGLDVLS